MFYIMRISSITLESYRKFENLHLSFGENEHIICFTGPNTIGKTNIIEAIYFLSLVKSFRTDHMESICRWDADYFSLRGTYLKDRIVLENQINIVLRPKKQRKLRMNGEELPYSKYVGMVPVVFFSPDDIASILESPASRRKYLDILLAQTDPHYLGILVNYQKALKQRNSLLRNVKKHQAQNNELDIWDESLARFGTQIYAKRLSLIAYFQMQMQVPYSEISGDAISTCTLEYVSKYTHEQIVDHDAYLEILTAHRDRDVIREATSFGPHRDNFIILKNNMDASTFASRGDIRSMILAMKLTELHYIQTITSSNPILLLDDVFSELDSDRQEYLISHIPEGIQTFITTTSPQIGVLEKRKKEVRFIAVDDLLAK